MQPLYERCETTPVVPLVRFSTNGGFAIRSLTGDHGGRILECTTRYRYLAICGCVVATEQDIGRRCDVCAAAVMASQATLDSSMRLSPDECLWASTVCVKCVRPACSVRDCACAGLCARHSVLIDGACFCFAHADQLAVEQERLADIERHGRVCAGARRIVTSFFFDRRKPQF
jgi:hypothetical protein